MKINALLLFSLWQPFHDLPVVTILSKCGQFHFSIVVYSLSHLELEAGINLGMGSANERLHYLVMSFISWALIQNNPCWRHHVCWWFWWWVLDCSLVNVEVQMWHSEIYDNCYISCLVLVGYHVVTSVGWSYWLINVVCVLMTFYVYTEIVYYRWLAFFGGYDYVKPVVMNEIVKIGWLKCWYFMNKHSNTKWLYLTQL